MKKLKLQLAELRVESFSAQPESGPASGTVVANSGVLSGCLSCAHTCEYQSCQGPIMCFPDSGLCGSGTPDC